MDFVPLWKMQQQKRQNNLWANIKLIKDEQKMFKTINSEGKQQQEAQGEKKGKNYDYIYNKYLILLHIYIF